MMKKTPRYSVIVPVYNAELTLERCVNSLLQQNCGDAEIILVNDGSLDRSSALCEKYAASNKQVKYINKKNGGVSSARNAGLEAATGQYILFVDSDDSVADNYFCQLDVLDSKGEYDFAWFSYKHVQGEKESDHILTVQKAETAIKCARLFSKAFTSKSINSPCNKRYCREIIKRKHLRFPEQLSIGEDIVFNLQYALYCKNCKISDKVLYSVYIDNQQSLSRKLRTDLSEQFSILDQEILKTIMTAEIEEADRTYYLRAIKYKKLRSVYSEAKRMHMAGKPADYRRACIRQMCDTINEDTGVLPMDLHGILFRMPVLLKMTSAIDLVGYLLANRV